MAGHAKQGSMKKRVQATGTLIAVDGVNGRAVMRTAAKVAAEKPRDRPGISSWDASGIFGDLDAAGAEVERPSARTLMLLYAADLAFRIRWEIRPALAEGRSVIAAPYVDTAFALGRAMGLNEAWLRSVFEFAPPATERRYVDGTSVMNTAGQGFIELACRMLAGMETRAGRLDLINRTQSKLKATRHRSRS
jgi:hypothetical protein